MNEKYRGFAVPALFSDDLDQPGPLAGLGLFQAFAQLVRRRHPLGLKPEAARKAGKNPFFDIQIPEAIISLKQGAGRLIRDYADKGVLVLCDPRLIANKYGQKFLKSLPPMKRTREQGVVVEFLKNLSSTESIDPQSEEQNNQNDG